MSYRTPSPCVIPYRTNEVRSLPRNSCKPGTPFTTHGSGVGTPFMDGQTYLFHMFPRSEIHVHERDYLRRDSARK